MLLHQTQAMIESSPSESHVVVSDLASDGEDDAEQEGRRAAVVRTIADWMRERDRFSVHSLRRHVVGLFEGLLDCEFGPLLNVARDHLRAEGLEFGPDWKRPGQLVRADDATAARRGISFARGTMRKGRRAAAIAACVRAPEKLDPVLRRALEGSLERVALVEAAARHRARRKLPGT